MIFGQRRIYHPYKTSGLNNVNIYIEIGDSNAGGPNAEPGGFDSKYQTSSRVKIYYKPTVTSADDGSWQLYNTRSSPINRRPGLITESPAGNAVGADQSFVYALTNSSLKHALRFFKLGIGGSTLKPVFDPGNDWSVSNGDLYTSLHQHFVRVGISKLTAEGFRNPVIKGIIVRLGTNDCKTALWDQAAFTAAIPVFVAGLRFQLGSPTIPIYWTLVKSDLGSAFEWNATNVGQCRTAILNCAAGGSTEISNFYVLNYDALTTHDGIHYDVNSFLTIGDAEAATMIALGD